MRNKISFVVMQHGNKIQECGSLNVSCLARIKRSNDNTYFKRKTRIKDLFIKMIFFEFLLS